MSNEDKARAKLQEVIAENERNGYPNIDRSDEAIAMRRRTLNIAGGKHKELSDFGKELEEHVIKGDLSTEQSAKVLLLLYGLS